MFNKNKKDATETEDNLVEVAMKLKEDNVMLLAENTALKATVDSFEARMAALEQAQATEAENQAKAAKTAQDEAAAAAARAAELEAVAAAQAAELANNGTQPATAAAKGTQDVPKADVQKKEYVTKVAAARILEAQAILHGR